MVDCMTYSRSPATEMCNEIALSFVLGKLYKCAWDMCVHGEIITLKFDIQWQMLIESFLIYNLLF